MNPDTAVLLAILVELLGATPTPEQVQHATETLESALEGAREAGWESHANSVWYDQ